MVTRHVLNGGGKKSPVKLPSPSANVPDAHSDQVSRLTQIIARQMGLPDWPDDDREEISLTLDGYSDALLTRMLQVCKDRTQTASAIGVMVYRDEPESFIREFAVFGGLVQDKTTGMEISMPFVRSLHHYPQLPQIDDYSQSDDSTKLACRELILLAAQLMDEAESFSEENQPIKSIQHDYDSYNTPIINSDGLVKLIVDRPEDAKRIGEIVMERKTLDAQTIVGVMDYNTKSLSSGVL